MVTPLKQSADKPLFPDIIWNLPINKNGAGKLLIVGGNAHKFFAPAWAKKTAEDAGAGIIKICMPEAVKKLVGRADNIEFLPSNQSGSFSNDSLEPLLSLSNWADCVLFAGDIGRSSESSLTIEKFLSLYGGLVVITQDALDMFVENPQHILQREDTILVASFSQLQKIASRVSFTKPFLLSHSQSLFAENLVEFASSHNANWVTQFHDKTYVAAGGNISLTHISKDVWRVEQSAKSATILMQQPEVPFEALTTSVLDVENFKQ